MVSDFLEIHFADSGSTIRNFALSTNYPKRQMEDMEATIEAEVRGYTVYSEVKKREGGRVSE